MVTIVREIVAAGFGEMSLVGRNYYQILGVNSGATAADIKRAYRRLAKEQHPDALEASQKSDEKQAATEEMMRINEAYAALSDATSRAEYDVKIGIKQSIYIKPVFTSDDEDKQREKFLRTIFYPIRSSIVKILNGYDKELKDLSADPFDDELMGSFQHYVEKLHAALHKGSDALGNNATPRSMEAAVHMMRHSIAQASDGMEELRYFCSNYDYSHLTMAENLFRISNDLSKQALSLTKNC